MAGAAFLGVFGGGMILPRLGPQLSQLAEGWSRPAKAIESSSADTFTCIVSSVHDGDTFRCTDGTRVRLAAVAARELDETCSPGHPCPAASGASAKEELERLALGETLTCEANGTTYGRIAAWCRQSDGAQLNCALVEAGPATR